MHEKGLIYLVRLTPLARVEATVLPPSGSEVSLDIASMDLVGFNGSAGFLKTEAVSPIFAVSTCFASSSPIVTLRKATGIRLTRLSILPRKSCA
jgi:hypothetical protein